MKKTDLRYVEKPDPKRPQLWMGYYDKAPDDPWERFRILYTDGKTEWITVGLFEDGDDWERLPCWHRCQPIMKSFKKRVRLMKKYDEQHGRKTMFLGNL